MTKLKKPLTVGWHTTQAAYDNTQTQTELQVAFSILNITLFIEKFNYLCHFFAFFRAFFYLSLKKVCTFTLSSWEVLAML